MVSLCDDLLQLTRSYLDYAGIVQGSRPVCLGSFTVGALIDEIDRQFAPIAQSAQLDWESHADSPKSPSSPTPRAVSRFSAISSPTPSSTRRWADCPSYRESRGQFLERDVRDTGPGIPRRGPRQGVRTVLSPVPRRALLIDGSGLGLAICRELAASTPRGNLARARTIGRRHVDFRPISPVG